MDLSFNYLTNLKLMLPENIEHCSLSGNQLKYWPFKNMPRNLLTLELQENELAEMLSAGKNQYELTFLKILNVSRNHITSLPSALRYPELEVFDGSFNEFSTVPPYLGSQAPKLKSMILRGNPIKTIEFITKISAHHFDLSELPLLTEFDAFAFNSIGQYFYFYFYLIPSTMTHCLFINIFSFRPKRCMRWVDNFTQFCAEIDKKFIWTCSEAVPFGFELQPFANYKSQLGQLVTTEPRCRPTRESNRLYMWIAMDARLFGTDAVWT